jgi:exopolysaccharide biosynthesis WecB/TagA/CpsF family protein
MRPRDLPLERRASLAAVAAGRARIVGSRTVAGTECLGLSPGMVSPYELRQAVGLRYGDPTFEEARWERQRSFLGDGALVARFLLSKAFAPQGKKRAERVTVLGVSLDALDTGEAIDRIVAFAREGSSRSVYFLHPHALNLAHEDTSLRAVIARADLALPDGAGLRVAASLLGRSLPANLNGTDLVPELLVELAVAGIPVALFGGAPGVAERAGKAFSVRYGVEIKAVRDGFGDAEGNAAWLTQVSAGGPVVLLVGIGSPLQERFVDANVRGRPNIVAVTVGGLFDFASNDKPRASGALRELGLEWVYRLALEPKRMARRYLVGNPLFVARVLRQRFEQP